MGSLVGIKFSHDRFSGSELKQIILRMLQFRISFSIIFMEASEPWAPKCSLKIFRRFWGTKDARKWPQLAM